MSDDKKVQLEVEFDVKDSTVAAAKKKLDDLAQKYEKDFKARRSALAGGGRFSPAFMMSDEELKKSTKNVEAAKSAYTKAVADFERKNTPVLKRAGGVFHKLLFGEHVNSDADAEKEHRKISNRMTLFQRQMHGTLALSAALSQTLTPLPGGGMLYAGVSGAASGYAQGGIDPETGERKKGISGLAGGLGGALKVGGTAMALLGLAKGVAGGIQGSREDENIFRSLSQAAGGDTGLGGRGLRAAYSQPGMTAAEASPFVGNAFRAGGGVGSAQGVLRAQVTAGMGAEYTQLLGGLARNQGGGTAQVDANGKKLWVDILATGMATGLQKGRIGELIVGAQRMADRTAAGVNAGDPSLLFKTASFLGQDSSFQGGRGFSTMGKLDEMSKGTTSPMARALALMRNGLGGGGGIVEAMRKSERGLFGEGGGGLEGLKEMVGQITGMTGGDRDQSSLLLSQSGGLGINEATKVLDLVREGKFGEKEFGDLKATAEVDEKAAYKAMIDAAGAWKGIDKTLEAINSVLGQLVKKLDGLNAVIWVLNATLDGLKAFSNFVDKAKEKGVIGALGDELAGGLGAVKPLSAHAEEYGADSEMFKQLRAATDATSMHDQTMEARRMAGELKGAYGPGVQVRPAAYQDSEKKFHFVIQVQKANGEMLRELEVKQKGEGTLAQTKVSTR